jgi:hypothetical protein
MPEIHEYKIEKRGGDKPWCVVSEDGSRDLGCFPTEAEANERLRQVEAAKAAKGMADDEKPAQNDHAADLEKEPDELPREYARLSGIEIFRTGTWNGDKYNAKDLDDIVSAFGKVGFQVPIKLGHKENSGDPAFGWVEAIRREGDRLVADFRDLPDRLFNLIKERRFDAVSSEIFWNITRGATKFRRALKAVALLGAEIPAVAGLKPLREAVEVNSLEADCHTYQIGTEELTMADQKVKADDKKDGAAESDEVKTLTADLAKAQEQIAKLTKNLEDKAQDDSPVLIKNLQEQVEALQKQTADAEERERQAKIQAKVDKVSIPAFRTHVAAMYDLATSVDPTKTVKFAVQDGDKIADKDTNPEAVIDDLVTRMNKHSEKLFREFGDAGDFRRDEHPKTEDPGEELDRLAKAYAAEKDVSYADALTAVQADPANRELVAAYQSS